MAKFLFTGAIPPKKNSRRTLPNGASIPSDRHRAWEQEWYSRVLEIPQHHGPVAIAFDWWAGGQVSPPKFDLNNSEESILDLLVEAERITGDDWWGVPQRTSRLRGLVRGETLCQITITAIMPPWAEAVTILRDKATIRANAKALGIPQTQYIASLWHQINQPCDTKAIPPNSSPNS